MSKPGEWEILTISSIVGLLKEKGIFTEEEVREITTAGSLAGNLQKKKIFTEGELEESRKNIIVKFVRKL